VPIHFDALDPFGAGQVLRIVWQLTVHGCGRTNAPFLKSSTRFAGANVGAELRSQTANSDPVTTAIACDRGFFLTPVRPVSAAVGYSVACR